jgi:hypothetical protein
MSHTPIAYTIPLTEVEGRAMVRSSLMQAHTYTDGNTTSMSKGATPTRKVDLPI